MLFIKKVYIDADGAHSMTDKILTVGYWTFLRRNFATWRNKKQT